MASIRALSKELQRKANEELNEDENRIEEDLQHIRDWVKKQPHLNIRQDDQWLVGFGRGCKWSLQRMKEKIDNFYTFRTLMPEIFADRDPFSSDIQKLLSAGYFCPLPNRQNSLGPKLVFFNFANIDTEDISNVVTSGFKVMFMSLEILFQEDDNFVISGIEAIADYKYFTLSFLGQCTPSLMMKATKVMDTAYPVRFKRYIAINITTLFDTMYNLIKPFSSEKMKKRMLMYNEANVPNAYKELDKSLFPVEYGGENGSIAEISKEWKLKVESYRDWFLDDYKYRSKEELRIDKSKHSFDEFGMEGAFRKLVID